MNIRVNCFLYGYFLERYIEKFGRKPKQWTIELLHDLWIRSRERSDKLNEEIWNYIKNIAGTIPEIDGKHFVYFRQNGDIRAYVIEWSNTFKSYTIHTTNLSEFKTRDERINFFISTDLNFEMGEELLRLNKLESKLHYRVFEIFWEKVEEQLQKKFKTVRPKESFVIKISDKKYIIKTEDRYGDYKKFKLECELTDDVTVIS